MQESRLILVEGMPGTGKTTVSQLIHQQLQVIGEDSCWYYEDVAPHPVRLYFEPAQHQSPGQYCEQVLNCWNEYVARLLQGDQIHVHDSAILQNHLRSMLLYDFERKFIRQVIDEIESKIRILNPTWLYLEPENVERVFQNLQRVRDAQVLDLWLEAQSQFPYDQHLAAEIKSGYERFFSYWEEYLAISSEIYEGLSIAKRKFVFPGNTKEFRTRFVLEFLKLPQPEAVSPCMPLVLLTGNYYLKDSTTYVRLELKKDGQELLAEICEPSLDSDQGPFRCYRVVRLIPQSDAVFTIAAWPHKVKFTKEGQDDVKMHISSPDGVWSEKSGVYLKSSSIA